MLVLPRLDGRFVQHSPDRAATDDFSQRGLRATHQIAERLPTQRLTGLGDCLARQCVNQSAVERGKKWVFARVLVDR